MGQTKVLSGAFEQGVIVGVCQELQHWTIKNGPPPKGHPANLTQLWKALESTWASIPVERF